jgi:RNA methyltransferase, TrmH family
MEAMHEKKYPLVSQSRDSRFVTLRFLQTPQGRSRSSLYLIEGIRHVARAVEQRAGIESVFVDPSLLSNPFGRKLAQQLRKSGVPGIRLAPHLYRELTLASEPQGIGAVVRQKWTPLTDVQPTKHSLWLAVESIESAGNLGTIIRTAEAAGVSGIFILDSDSDPYDPAAVRASMGSLFSQKLIRCFVRELTAWAKNLAVAIVSSSPAGLLDYKALRYRWPFVLAVGNERQGISDSLVGASDFTVRIPMRGRGDSINVAVAAGVLLFEMASQCPH